MSRPPIAERLARLGVRRLLLAIHDTSFPSDPDEDTGRGSPATAAAARLMAYAKSLGFTGIQLGPQGQTSRSNPSPYDSTIFGRHVGSIAIASLRKGGAFEGLVAEREIDRALAGSISVANSVPGDRNHATPHSNEPDALLSQTLEAMRLEMIDAKKTVAHAIADEKKLQKQLHAETDEAVAAQLLQEWNAQKQVVETAKVGVRNLNNTIEETKRKRNILVERSARAKLMPDSPGSTPADSAPTRADTSGFDTVERIRVMEAEVERANRDGAGASMSGTRARHRHAYDTMHSLVDAAWRAYRAAVRPDLVAPFTAFRAAHASWIEREALYLAICDENGGHGFRSWPQAERDLWLEAARDIGEIKRGARARIDALLVEHADLVERHAFGQFLVHREHQRVREQAAKAGLALYGDLQVGYADADAWAYAPVFRRDYVMGAPPSRTNPEGQPWGYPVLDPAQYDGAATALVIARAEKAFAEYDSVRIDHPHGLICPWVYRADDPDPASAVRAGARLFESPDLDDHPALAELAIARGEQIDRAQARYADRWVRELEAAQIDRYAALFDALVASARANGRDASDLSCEVLSTMPTPLEAVLARYDLGRWRITQKANLDDEGDVYRAENARRQDWVMLGNHDTAPIFALLREWTPAKREQWARHLAARLRLAQPERLASDGFFASAMVAELFVSRAENVSIFFADLFGITERFNVPGLVDDANWTLRLPADFERLHVERLARGEALDLELAVDLALAALPA